MEIKSYSRHHIDAVIVEEETSFKWKITGFYGHPKTHCRKESWSFLNTLRQQYQLLWLCLGDFNEILKRDEKVGGSPRPHQQIEAFQNIVGKCDFKDMGYSGPDYTWCNQQEGEDRVYIRLDRAFATMEWLDHFQNIKVQHLVDTTSDHFPILLAHAKVLKERRKRKFHFEAIWTRRADCKELIKGFWDGGINLSSPNGLGTGLKQCAEALVKWSESAFGQIPRKIQEKKRTISELIKGDSEGQNGPKINRLKREVNKLLDEEEIWLQQRSRVQWLGEGDRNTKYFHHRSVGKRTQSLVYGTMMGHGVRVKKALPIQQWRILKTYTQVLTLPELMK